MACGRTASWLGTLLSSPCHAKSHIPCNYSSPTCPGWSLQDVPGSHCRKILWCSPEKYATLTDNCKTFLFKSWKLVHLKELLCKESFVAALDFRTANLDQTALVWVGNSRIWIFVMFNIYETSSMRSFLLRETSYFSITWAAKRSNCFEQVWHENIPWDVLLRLKFGQFIASHLMRCGVQILVVSSQFFHECADGSDAWTVKLVKTRRWKYEN